MHIPSCNSVRSPALLTSFLRQHPLGLLITSQPLANQPDLQASHIPWVIDIPSEFEPLVHEARKEWDEGAPVQVRDAREPTEGQNPDAWDTWKGNVVLRGHMARANPQAKALIATLSGSSSTAPQSVPVLVMFTLPSHTYISPSFYTSTKPVTGKVVPTWDYAAIEVHGRLYLPPPTDPFLYNQMNALTEQEEHKVGGEWKVHDAPEGYRKVLERAVIGLRVEVESMEGRWKLSQEKNGGDWNGVVNGVKALSLASKKAANEPDGMVDLVEKAGWRWGQDGISDT